jgi:arabinofuranan 3-O-arabinosyltransferase
MSTLGTYSIDATPDFRLARPIELTVLVLCVSQATFLLATLAYGHWIVRPDGTGAETDFVNVWAAGRLVWAGQPAAAYDWALHKAAEVAAVGREFDTYYPWFYPPPFLFVAGLLALLPYSAAFAAWVTLTLPAYVLSIRAIVGHRLGVPLACAIPAVLMNAVVGQNGYVTAALIGGALHLMERRPALAGMLIGLLTYKPHLGLLFPLALAAGGRWRVFGSAAFVAALLMMLSYSAFGAATWEAFARSLPVASQAVLTDGRGDFLKIHSAFALVRVFGGGEGLAWVLQGSVIAVSAIYVGALWYGRAPFELKAAALATAALLVTLYLYVYDLVVLAVPMAFLVYIGRNSGFMRGEPAGLLAAGLLILIFLFIKIPIGLAAVLIVAALVVRRVHTGIATVPLPSPRA